jgi:hypothetical protein
MSNTTGFTRPGVECSHCGEPFALFLATRDVKKVGELPDPFRAKCPRCQTEATYPRSAIEILAAVSDR